MTEIIKVNGLAYKYPNGVFALKQISFCLGQSQNIALVGANGSGKSTLLHLLTGVLSPSAGEIYFKENLLMKKNLPQIREKIGLVFQNADNQLFCGTVYEDVAFGPLNMGLSTEQAAQRTNSTLAAFNIGHLAQRPPYTLSAGEKRLASLSAVMAMKPEVLLLDEPTAELDPRARRDLIILLNNLKQPKIIATHDLDFAVKTCERVWVLHKGEIAVTGEAAAVLSDEQLLLNHGL